MRWKKFLSQLSILLIIILVGFIPALFFYFIQQSSNLPVSLVHQGFSELSQQVQNALVSPVENAVTFQEQEQPLSGVPVHLKIPKIHVDTTLESVGLTTEGAVDVPKGPTDAAWFNLGPRPGDNGCAVITGHYGRWKNGEESVFNKLNKLSKGDILSVEDEEGVTTTFVVSGSREYDPNADASDVFISSDGKAHLNLITCDGSWSNTQKSYSKRLVVFADKE